MGARHQETIGTHVKKHATYQVNKGFQNTGKIPTYQHPYTVEPRPITGGGFQVGGGTAFPILYPIIDLGDLTDAHYVFDLGDQTLHYQKMNIKRIGGNIAFDFAGLIQDRSVVLTLDVTIGVNGVATIQWPANLYGVPAGLPTAINSRYILYITGFKDGTEERYYVVNSTTGSTSSAWSSITPIDVDKDMNMKSLFNLSNIQFDTDFDGKLRQIKGLHGTGTIFDLGTAGSPVSGEGYFFKINNSEKLQISSTQIIAEENVIPLVGSLKFGDTGAGQQWFKSYFTNIILDTAEQYSIFKDNLNPFMDFEVPTAAGFRWAVNNIVKMYLDTGGTTLHAPVIIADSGDFALGSSFGFDPLANGEFTLNGTNVKVMSGGAVRNLSLLPTTGAANVALSNLSTTSINQDLLSDGFSRNLGDSTHFWVSAFAQAYYVKTTNISIGNDGSDDLVIALRSLKFAAFTFNSTTAMLLDGNNGFLNLQGPIFGLSINQGSHEGKIIKFSGQPMELYCIDGIQLDHNLLPQDSNIQTIGTSLLPFFNGIFLNHEIIAGSGSSQFFKQNISANYINFLYNSSATNTGYNFQINSTIFLNIVHNTGNEPIDFLYAPVPLWMVGTYIQFDEISDPVAPPLNKARLFTKDNGAGKTQLCVRFNTGAVQVIATQP